MFMSAKTTLSDIILVFYQKGKKIIEIFAIKVAFSGLCFVFRVALLTFYMF